MQSIADMIAISDPTLTRLDGRVVDQMGYSHKDGRMVWHGTGLGFDPEFELKSIAVHTGNGVYKVWTIFGMEHTLTFFVIVPVLPPVVRQEERRPSCLRE